MPGQAIVTIRDKPWACSVASTPAELATGLSGVPGIPPGTGMLFVLPQEQIVTVTAVDMLFPLSVIFIGENLLVTEVALLLSPGDWGTTTLPCRYFLEGNVGEADGIEAGDPVSIELSATPSTDWMAPVVTLAGAVLVGALMAKMGKTMADALFGKPKEKPVLYGPRGERLSPAARKTGSFVIGHDYMGNLIITHTERTGEIFLQFESDRQIVYDILKKWELKEVEKGWSVQVKDTEPRASILDELWESSAQPKKLPQTGKRKPTRQEVEIGTWAERDRIGIWLTDKRTGKTVTEWWDEDAREMFEQGWFKPGDIRHQTITGRAFEESVLDYAESVGLLAGSGKYLAQTIKDACYWTAINKDTGEIVESSVPYTSSGRALRGGKAWASRHWRGAKALVEVWRQPFRYSESLYAERLKIQPVASEMITLAKSSAVIPTEPRRPRPRRKDELEFLPDSPEFLAYTIEDIGYREKIDHAFLGAIARARKGR
jgi:uncharacterized membrane protein (UPF0127 family)